MGGGIAATPAQRLPDSHPSKTENGLEAYKTLPSSLSALSRPGQEY
jgi:hypothetical protein